MRALIGAAEIGGVRRLRFSSAIRRARRLMRSSVGQAFAWDDKLVVKDAPAFREAILADRAGKQYPRFGLKKPDATGKEQAGPPPRRLAAGSV